MTQDVRAPFERELGQLKRLEEFSLSDLEGVSLVLRGESVIDWHRLDFADEESARRFLLAQEFRPDEPADDARLESIKNEAIAYLRRNFDFPIPKPVAAAPVIDMLMLASSKGHRQLCACTILKTMHIIHHLDGRELLFSIPMSDHDVFHLVEEKVYRVIDTADAILGRYFRGAVIVAVLQGFIAFAGLWFLGVDYPVVLGIMTGILNFIPYVGLLTSLVVASIVAVFSGGPIMIKVLGVVVLYLAQKLLEATVLGPKIVGSQVGLHPVLLILCLLVFGHFLGFVGLLIAVPVTAVLMAFFREWEAAREAGA